MKGFVEQVGESIQQHFSHMVSSKDDSWLVDPDLQARVNHQDDYAAAVRAEIEQMDHKSEFEIEIHFFGPPRLDAADPMERLGLMPTTPRYLPGIRKHLWTAQAHKLMLQYHPDKITENLGLRRGNANYDGKFQLYNGY